MIEFVQQNWRYVVGLLVVFGSMALTALVVALLFVRPERLARAIDRKRHEEELTEERAKVARLAAWQAEEPSSRRTRHAPSAPCFCQRTTIQP